MDLGNNPEKIKSLAHQGMDKIKRYAGDYSLMELRLVHNYAETQPEISKSARMQIAREIRKRERLAKATADEHIARMNAQFAGVRMIVQNWKKLREELIDG